MKKEITFLSVSAALLLSLQVKAQVNNPEAWETFVEGADNVAVCDTFRMQSFSSLPGDNWNYEVSYGEPRLKDASQIQNASSQYALQLYPGEKVTFDSFSDIYSAYSKVLISCPFAMRNINRDEPFLVTANSVNGNDRVDKAITVIPEDGFDSYFNEKIVNKGEGSDKDEYSCFLLGYDCTDLSIRIDGTKRGDDSYYLLDCVLAYGNIQKYSLFSGTGLWSDEARWSHLPALRHRHALVQGRVTVDEPIHCDTIHLSGGDIQLLPEAALSTKVFTFYQTFAEKGVWYFVSFPFDVYAGQVDPDFQQGDEDTTGSGNYFYVKTYDGESRAEGSAENWKTLRILSPGELLFEKGKGYLLALDAKATKQTICFTSRDPQHFASSVSLSVEGSSLQGATAENSGWVLCGNPYPGNLNLADLEVEGSDGYVYVYENGQYQAYPIGSNTELPVGSAFFLKVEGDTQLSVSLSGTAVAKRIAPTSMLRTAFSEPGEMPTSVEKVVPSGYRLSGNCLHFPSSDDSRTLSVFDFSGRPCLRMALPSCASSVNLPVPSGLYIINVVENGTQEVWRAKWNQR